MTFNLNPHPVMLVSGPYGQYNPVCVHQKVVRTPKKIPLNMVSTSFLTPSIFSAGLTPGPFLMVKKKIQRPPSQINDKRIIT